MHPLPGGVVHWRTDRRNCLPWLRRWIFQHGAGGELHNLPRWSVVEQSGLLLRGLRGRKMVC